MDSRLVAALRKAACPGPEPPCRSDPIDLSNACRAFYQSRLESARALKERWGPSGSRASGLSAGEASEGGGGDDGGGGGGGGGDTGTSDRNENCRKKSSIDVAMETLRQEMTSLMEQDLSLMKQLLTLNEEIEELKWRRRYCWSRASVMTSSGDVDLGSLASFTSSDASLGWWRESGDLPPKYPGISSLSLHAADHNRLSVYDEEDPTGTFNRHAARRQGSLRTLPAPGHASSQGHLQHKHHLDTHHHHHYHNNHHQHENHRSLHEPLRHHATQPNLHESHRQHDALHHHRDSSLTHRQHQTVGTAGDTDRDEDFAERESFDSGIHEGYSDTSQTLQHTNSTTEMTHL